MKSHSPFFALICLFMLAAWSFGENKDVGNMSDSSPVIEEQNPTDGDVLFAKKKQSRKKSKEQQLNEWFYSLSLSDKELLYQLKPEIDKQRKIQDEQIHRYMMNGWRNIAQR